MSLFKTTNRWRRYWSHRKIDWQQSYGSGADALNHPHRQIIVDVTKKLPVGSVMEIGMGGGSNLIRLQQAIPSLQVGGCDVSEEAVKAAKAALPKSQNILDVRDATDLFFSDKSVDMALTDMALIYLNPKEVRKALKEIKRVTRKYALFVEFHHTSFWKRLALRLTSGYWSYRYDRLLEEMEFHDVEILKIPEAAWPGGFPQSIFGHVILAKV